MFYRRPLLLLVSIFLFELIGCSRKAEPIQATPSKAPAAAKAATVTFPELSASRPIQPGVLFQEATIHRNGVPMRVWFYMPEQGADKLSLVLVPPAGSTLFAGMDLGDGDRPEHYPYVKAGFAVVSFEIDGHVQNKESEAAILEGARQFRHANAGIDNARVTLDFVLAKASGVNPERVYIAGHSSAATLALLVAEHDPRIKACAAFAPVTNVANRLGDTAVILDRAIPSYREFIQFSSPMTHVDKLKCPVFLFHAVDDSTVPISQTTTFADALKKTNPTVTLVQAARGGHYDSMIQEGMPKAIEWLKQQP